MRSGAFRCVPVHSGAFRSISVIIRTAGLEGILFYGAKSSHMNLGILCKTRHLRSAG